VSRRQSFRTAAVITSAVALAVTTIALTAATTDAGAERFSTALAPAARQQANVTASTPPANLAPWVHVTNVPVTATPTVSAADGAVTVNLTATNQQQVAANDVRVRFALPVGATPGASDGCAVANLTVSCTLGSLAVGESRSAVVRFSLTPLITEGTPLGTVLPTLSDGWDPDAGEVLASEWNNEYSLGDGDPIVRCWPTASAAPNQTGTNDPTLCDPADGSQPATPSAVRILTDPTQFASLVVNTPSPASWEFRARIQLDSSSGAANNWFACLAPDDGGYVAVSAAGTPFAAQPDLNVDRFTSAAAFAALGNNKSAVADVLVRIQNRGPKGVQNPAVNPGGWGSFGIVKTNGTCNGNGFGSNGWTTSHVMGQPLVAPAVTPPRPNLLRILGTVSSSDGTALSARVRNDGPAPANVVALLSTTPSLRSALAQMLAPGGATTVRFTTAGGASALEWQFFDADSPAAGVATRAR
jgi:hypothetical protein